MTFHTLRHTFASHLVMGGTDLKTVGQLMGHKSLSMTLRYSHLSPQHKTRAIGILEDRLGLTEEVEQQGVAGVNFTLQSFDSSTSVFFVSPCEISGPARARTWDQWIMSPLLYRLSYGPGVG